VCHELDLHSNNQMRERGMVVTSMVLRISLDFNGKFILLLVFPV
jgi:hypothetical protein